MVYSTAVWHELWLAVRAGVSWIDISLVARLRDVDIMIILYILALAGG